MTNLVLNFECLLLLCFLTEAEFWTLGHLQGIIRVPYFKRDNFELIWTSFRSNFNVGWKKNQNNSTINSPFDALSKWQDPHHSLFGFKHFSTHITFDFGLSMCIFFGGFQLVDYITLVYRIEVHACLLILRKKSSIHGLILVCTFIDFRKKIPPAHLFGWH